MAKELNPGLLTVRRTLYAKLKSLVWHGKEIEPRSSDCNVNSLR